MLIQNASDTADIRLVSRSGRASDVADGVAITLYAERD